MEVQPDVGARVRIGPRDAELERMHPSYIADADSAGGIFAVAVPAESVPMARARSGDSLRVCLFTESGLICARPRVLGRKEGAPSTLTLENPGGWMRIQRREHVRIPCSLDLEIRPIEGEKQLESGGWNRERTLDLSAGGAKVQCTLALEVGEPLDLILHLPEDTLCTRAWVLRHLGRGEGDRGAIYALQFTALSQDREDEIVSFVFAEQMRRRRAGLVD